MQHAFYMENTSISTPVASSSCTLSIKDPRNESCSIRSQVPIPLGKTGGLAEFITFHGLSDGLEHFCIGFGEWRTTKPTLVRIHSECITGDMFGSLRCDCGPQLAEACELMSSESGLIVYLRQEGRGIGLYNKLDAYELQSKGLDTFEANTKLGFEEDERSYLSAAEMLKCLGIRSVCVLTNNPQKVSQLRDNGVDISSVRKTGHFHNPHNDKYLAAKSRSTVAA